MAPHCALFHLDEGSRLRVETVLRAIGTLLGHGGADHVEVEVVATGEGLRALRRTANPDADTVTRLAARGVRFVACADAARRLGLAREALLEPVALVPSGISELVWQRAATQGVTPSGAGGFGWLGAAGRAVIWGGRTHGRRNPQFAGPGAPARRGAMMGPLQERDLHALLARALSSYHPRAGVPPQPSAWR
jgi:uncharacterized protein